MLAVFADFTTSKRPRGLRPFLFLFFAATAAVSGCKTDMNRNEVFTEYRLNYLGEAAVELAVRGEPPDRFEDVNGLVRTAVLKNVLDQTSTGIAEDFTRDGWGEMFSWSVERDAANDAAVITITSRGGSNR